MIRFAVILFLSGGATMILAGCLAPVQAVIYPIRDNIDNQGRLLINWVFEMETPTRSQSFTFVANIIHL